MVGLLSGCLCSCWGGWVAVGWFLGVGLSGWLVVEVVGCWVVVGGVWVVVGLLLGWLVGWLSGWVVVGVGLL